ncbi:GyrI-like domain-containing protein [uncultured Ruminococcus sp.]|uniref:GyrI-like domain-containing protein n=1 Tax=uncultured Ruminococcus sp. TaxID=165186 RepID=UPI0025EF116A|nr:GyrI-like domain-containing protein [uncultured Ruminococcus sp.]
MQVTYAHKPEMTLIGFSTTIRPEEGYVKCPQFWEEEYTRKYAKLWQTMQPETPVEQAILRHQIGMFAICSAKGDVFEYWIAGIYQGGEVPEGLKLFTFPESDWAMFSAKGPLPGSLQTLNTQVWNEWFPHEGKQYGANAGLNLEVYSAGDMQSPDYECGIWIPVQRSKQQADTTAETVASMTNTGIL